MRAPGDGQPPLPSAEPGFGGDCLRQEPRGSNIIKEPLVTTICHDNTESYAEALDPSVPEMVKTFKIPAEELHDAKLTFSTRCNFCDVYWV